MPMLDLYSLLPIHAWIRVVSLMFAPDSPKTRALFENTMRELPVAEEGLILSASLETARREMLAAIRDDWIPKGTIAARIMVMTFASEGQDVNATMDTIIQAEKQRRGYSKSSLRRTWEQFRDIAHLWLAYEVCTGGPPLRPLGGLDLAYVLNTADGYRRHAETYLTGNKQVPLIDPADAWRFRLPDGLSHEIVVVAQPSQTRLSLRD
jgi:hypothetical protein